MTGLASVDATTRCSGVYFHTLTDLTYSLKVTDKFSAVRGNSRSVWESFRDTNPYVLIDSDPGPRSGVQTGDGFLSVRAQKLGQSFCQQVDGAIGRCAGHDVCLRMAA